MHTNVRCPGCARPFHFDVDDGTTLVWCANRHCESDMGKRGLKSTERVMPNVLADRLRAGMDEERDWIE